MKNKAIILGAGPTGLITAWRLLESGWQVTIIEKNKIAGGLCRSKKWIYSRHRPSFFIHQMKFKNFGKNFVIFYRGKILL